MIYVTKLVNQIFYLISYEKFYIKSIFEKYSKYYETLDFIYDFNYQILPSKCLIDQNTIKLNKKTQDITLQFYEGFGVKI